MSIPSFLVFAALFATALVARTAEPHPSLPPPVIPDCLGVNIHFTDPKPGELEMLAAAGFRWVRMDFTWAGTERKKGEYDFSAYDRLVAALDQHKLRAVFILDYGNKLYPNAEPPTTDEARAAFSKWAVAAVSHFKGRGYLWEMWNEPNGGFWKSSDKTGDYIALAKATGEALRKAGLVGSRKPEGGSRNEVPAREPASQFRVPTSDFGEAFIGPATSTIDLPYLEACFKAGLLDFWDAVSVHPYRQSAPETVEEEYRSLRLLIRKYAPAGKTIPIISGEWGYSTAWQNFDEEKQAKYLPRQFLTNIANDVVLSIWYDWHDDGTNPKDPEHHFGIVRNEYHGGRDPVFDPKPAYQAMKTLTGQLGGFELNKELAFGFPGQHPLLFSKDKVVRIAFWGKSRDPESRSDWIPASPGKVAVTGYRGEVLPPLQVKDEVPYSLQLRIDDAPQYLAPERPNEILSIATAWKRAPLDITLDPTNECFVENSIRNPMEHPINVRIGTEKRRLAPGEILLSKTSIAPSRDENANVLLELWVENQSLAFQGRGTTHISQAPRLIPAKPLRLTLLASIKTAVPVRVENPEGDSFEGTIHLVREDDSEGNALESEIGSAKLVFNRGEKEKVVLMQMSLMNWFSRAIYPIYPIVTNRGGQIVFLGKGEMLRPIESLVKPDAHSYRIIADGDAAVDFKQSLEIRQPADEPCISGAEAIKLAYHLESGWKFLRLVSTKLVPVKRAIFERGWQFLEEISKATAESHTPRDARKLALWLHGDGKGCQARVRFKDSTGQVFQPDGPRIDWKGWRYVTFSMQPTDDKPLAHWGGANDGVSHYPIKWDTIFLLDNVSREPVEGEIYLSAPTLIY